MACAIYVGGRHADPDRSRGARIDRHVGDAYALNALAESFVDSYKTELIVDRVWRCQAQLELATVDWVAWFNAVQLHSSLGDVLPVEIEQRHAAARAPGAGAGAQPIARWQRVA